MAAVVMFARRFEQPARRADRGVLIVAGRLQPTSGCIPMLVITAIVKFF